MNRTTDRSDLIAQLLAPYSFMTNDDKFIGVDYKMSAIWALIAGSAELVADALLEYPDSLYWRNTNPIEDGGTGAAVRWYRETKTSAPRAGEHFLGFATVPGCEVPHTTARIIRWMIEQGFDAQAAIAYSSKDGDEPIDELFDSTARERMLRGAYASLDRRAEAGRVLRNDWHD